jgi:hypothetical protein
LAKITETRVFFSLVKEFCLCQKYGFAHLKLCKGFAQKVETICSHCLDRATEENQFTGGKTMAALEELKDPKVLIDPEKPEEPKHPDDPKDPKICVKTYTFMVGDKEVTVTLAIDENDVVTAKIESEIDSKREAETV